MSIFQPIQQIADFTTYNLLKIGEGTYLGNAVNFFIFDLIKIGLLLVVINFFVEERQPKLSSLWRLKKSSKFG